jgi:hypothetical protein
LTDWLPESGARQHLNGCHCHLKISARATLSLKYAVNGLLSGGAVLRGWVRSVSGSTAQGLPSIEGGLAEKQTIGAILFVTFDLELKAEALHLADRIAKLLRQSKRRSRWVKVSDALSRLRNCTVSRGVFLTKVGGDEADIEEMFREAIRTAKEQKSTCLTKRAEATYTNSAAERESVRGNTGSDCLLQISCSSLPFPQTPTREILSECRVSQCRPSSTVSGILLLNMLLHATVSSS